MKKILAIVLAIAFITLSLTKAMAQSQPIGFGYRLPDEAGLPLNAALTAGIAEGLYRAMQAGHSDEAIAEYGEEALRKEDIAAAAFATAIVTVLVISGGEYAIGNGQLSRSQANTYWKNQIITFVTIPAWAAIHWNEKSGWTKDKIVTAIIVTSPLLIAPITAALNRTNVPLYDYEGNWDVYLREPENLELHGTIGIPTTYLFYKFFEAVNPKGSKKSNLLTAMGITSFLAFSGESVIYPDGYKLYKGQANGWRNVRDFALDLGGIGLGALITYNLEFGDTPTEQTLPAAGRQTSGKTTSLSKLQMGIYPNRDGAYINVGYSF